MAVIKDIKLLMANTLMPRATALWLIDNTSLTFPQIAEFCGLHLFEVESLADGNMDKQLSGFDPVASSQLTREEIRRCEKDATAKLQMKKSLADQYLVPKARKYTPKAKRQDKPDAILWLIKYYPEIPDKDICDLLGTTKITVHSVRNKTHKNMSELSPRNPVNLGLCSQSSLDFVVAKLNRS